MMGPAYGTCSSGTSLMQPKHATGQFTIPRAAAMLRWPLGRRAIELAEAAGCYLHVSRTGPSQLV